MLAIGKSKQLIKGTILTLFPLSVRKRLALWINKQSFLDFNRRSWWSLELVRDLAEKNINDYHKFLWSNHLAYASTYEVSSRFGRNNMQESRRIFFSYLNQSLIELGRNPLQDVKSVFEVGCSLGYQLRYMETDLFPSAVQFEGIDIDEHAINTGSNYLNSIGSNVKLFHGDMEGLGNLIQNKIYDIFICSGVLMYLNEESATQVVDTMLQHTQILLAFAALAHPDVDNSQLLHSVTREKDGSFIHNIDSMVKKAGGDIVARRWEGSKLVDGHTIYFIFAKRQM